MDLITKVVNDSLEDAQYDRNVLDFTLQEGDMVADAFSQVVCSMARALQGGKEGQVNYIIDMHA